MDLFLVLPLLHRLIMQTMQEEEGNLEQQAVGMVLL
jgi:hypothetical protein